MAADMHRYIVYICTAVWVLTDDESVQLETQWVRTQIWNCEIGLIYCARVLSNACVNGVLPIGMPIWTQLYA